MVDITHVSPARGALTVGGPATARTEATMVETITRHGVNGTAHESTSLLEGLIERIGGQARASTIYGEPIVREEVTVIPVARAMWGCGGGTGSDDEHEVGSGGGGGLLVSPVGYIEIRDGSSCFRPIVKPPLGVVGLVVGAILGLAIARIAGTRCRSQAVRGGHDSD